MLSNLEKFWPSMAHAAVITSLLEWQMSEAPVSPLLAERGRTEAQDFEGDCYRSVVAGFGCKALCETC